MDNDCHTDDMQSTGTPSKDESVEDEDDGSTLPKQLFPSGDMQTVEGNGATPTKQPFPRDNEKESSEAQPSLFRRAACAWSYFTHLINHVILSFVVTLSMMAAKNPKSTIVGVVCLSFGLLGTGFMTNFHVELKEDQMLAPFDSPVREQMQYISQVEYPPLVRYIILLVHNDGRNALTYDAVDIIFQAVDLAMNVEPYDEFCGPEGCDTIGVPRWWDMNSTLFRNDTKGSDDLTRLRISNNTWSDGTPVPQELFIGHLEKDDDGLCTFATSVTATMLIPETGDDGRDAAYLELYVVNALHELRDRINEDPDNSLTFEFVTVRSYPDELLRAIQKDMPLIPLVVIMMTLFTCSMFFRNDKVQSRTLVGIGSVTTIALALMSGYGFAFIIGIPFTSMSQLLPFVLFGVGLDDTFVIMGAYLRTDPSKDAVARVEETMTEVGNSIAMTTITTVVAFILGCTSTIPCIRWLCLYAFLTVAIDFIYQITLFVAMLVLDERRIQSRRRDVFCCVQAKDTTENNDQEQEHSDAKSQIQHGNELDSPPLASQNEAEQQTSETQMASGTNEHASTVLQRNSKILKAPLVDRCMSWYADRLLHPKVKVLVVFVFSAFLGASAYCATMLEQRFDTKEFMPEGSFVVSFLDAIDAYLDHTFRFPLVFRFVNQTDPEVQEQMISFLEDMVALPQFGEEPQFCWVTDLKKLRTGEFEDQDIAAAFEDFSWILNDNKTTELEKLKVLLKIPQISSLYEDDIAWDENGNVESSRCWLSVTKLRLNDVDEQSQFYLDIEDVMAKQPVNRGGKEYAFFAYDLIFFLWEFFVLAVDALISNTIQGVVAVSVLGLILIPHWTSIFFITPLIIVLYIDLLGTIQMAGLYINPITYVCLVISIGLLVDFLMHFLLRFYESEEPTRTEKVKDAIRTMGASILLGGLSTMLGVAPLAFSTSAIMRTVFICFIAIISLGLSHGLILLPVLLSYCGPEVCVKAHNTIQKPQNLEANNGKCEEPHEHESGQETHPVTIDVDSRIEHIHASSPVPL